MKRTTASLSQISEGFRRVIFPVLICGVFFPSPADEPIAHPRRVDIRGRVAALQADGGGTVTVLIEGEKEPDTSNDKASVRVTAKTRLVNSAGEKVSFAYLRVSQRVEARFTGPVAESYPVQAVAAEIWILGAKQSATPQRSLGSGRNNERPSKPSSAVER